jgi:hypothetical protein
MSMLLDKIREEGLADSLLFNVRSENVMTGDGIVIKGKRAIVSDSDKVLGIVSDKYKVVTNHDVLLNMGLALEESGLDTTDFSVSAVVGYNGARAMVNLELPAHKIEVKGDVSTLRVTVLNSYDGRWKFRAFAGALRMACMNGNVFHSTLAGAYSDFHTQRLDVEAGAAHLFKMAELFDKSQDWYNAMIERKVDREQLMRSLAIFLTGNSKVKDREAFTALPTTSRILDLFDMYSKEFGPNAYALYNALTDWVTHKKYTDRTKAGMLMLGQEKLENLMARSSLFATE